MWDFREVAECTDEHRKIKETITIQNLVTIEITMKKKEPNIITKNLINYQNTKKNTKTKS